jgi:hypothetical protein
VRIADSNTNSYRNSDGDGYTELYARLVCWCAAPNSRRAFGWRLFPG